MSSVVLAPLAAYWGTIGHGGLCRHLHRQHAEHVLAINTQGLSTAMAVAREQPGTYTVQQLWERVQA